MRPFAMVVMCVVAGCSRTTPEPGPTASSAAVPQPKPAAQPAGLYTDEEIKKLAPFDIDREADVFDVPCLDVVPSGESYPRERVFKALNIDDARIRNFRESGINFVVFLTWQVSSSYDICCMTAINDLKNDGLDMTDPKRKVYGIRLVKRPK